MVFMYYINYNGMILLIFSDFLGAVPNKPKRNAGAVFRVRKGKWDDVSGVTQHVWGGHAPGRYKGRNIYKER